MKVTAAEQELLLPEIALFAAALRDPTARTRYQELRAAVEAGEVDDGLAGHLANILQIGLESGRIRQRYGADGEQALTKLFHRTPAGAALAEQAEAVSKALAALQGQVIDRVSVSAQGPGSYGMLIDTDACQISIRFERGGVRVDNLAVGV